MRYNQRDFTRLANAYSDKNHRSLNMKPEFCNGFTAYWLYKMAINQSLEFYCEMELLQHWDIEQGQAPKIDVVLNHIIFLQMTTPSLIMGMPQTDIPRALNILLGQDREAKRFAAAEFQFSHVLYESELAQLLTEVVHKGKYIVIGPSYHAMGLFYDGRRYLFFDPDYAINDAFEFKNLAHVATYIMDNYSDGRKIEIGLDVFDLEEGPKAEYPSYPDLLAKLQCDDRRIESLRHMIHYHHNELFFAAIALTDLHCTTMDFLFDVAICQHNHAVIRELIAIGYQLNITDDAGNYPIFKAIDSGNSDTLSIIVEAGASLDVVDSFGSPPIHYAIEQDKNDAISTLLKAGANPLKTNDDGDDALRVAIRIGNCDSIDALFEHTDQEKYALDHYYQCRYSLLTLACHLRKDEVVRCLIKQGLDINARDLFLITPLQQCALDNAVECARVLLDHSADASMVTLHSLRYTAALIASLTEEIRVESKPNRSDSFFKEATPDNRDRPAEAVLSGRMRS